MKKRKASPTQLLLHLIFLIVSLTFILPIVLILIISLTSEQSLLINGYSFFPKEWSTAAYRYVFSGATSILNAYAVTIFITVVGTFLHLLICSMMAYALSRPEVTYSKRIMMFIYIPVLFSGGMVPYYMLIVKGLKLKDSIWVLLLICIVSATHILIMRNYFATIPNSLIESARIDGSGEFKTFFKIVVPISTPSFATIGLFAAIAYWNDWYTASLFIENPKLYPLQYLLQSMMNNIKNLQANADRNPSLMQQVGQLPSESARMATCLLSIGPIILLYPLLQKYFQKGLTLGAVKG